MNIPKEYAFARSHGSIELTDFSVEFGFDVCRHNGGCNVRGQSDTWTRAGNVYLRHTQQHHSVCLSLFLSLSFALWHTHEKKNWTRSDVFSFREKLSMIPITIILMEIIIIMTVRIIVLILFVFKTPFYFVCLLHVCVTLCSNSIL